MAVRGSSQVRVSLVFFGSQCDEYTDYGVVADIRQAIIYGCCDLDIIRPHVQRLAIWGKFLTGPRSKSSFGLVGLSLPALACSSIR